MKIPLLNGDSEPFVPGTPGPFSATEPETWAYFKFSGYHYQRREGSVVQRDGAPYEGDFYPDNYPSYTPHLNCQGPKLGDKA